MMGKKDYELVAKVIGRKAQGKSGNEYFAVSGILAALAKEFIGADQHFDKDKFWEVFSKEAGV